MGFLESGSELWADVPCQPCFTETSQHILGYFPFPGTVYLGWGLTRKSLKGLLHLLPQKSSQGWTCSHRNLNLVRWVQHLLAIKKDVKRNLLWLCCNIFCGKSPLISAVAQCYLTGIIHFTSQVPLWVTRQESCRYMYNNYCTCMWSLHRNVLWHPREICWYHFQR